MSQAKINNPASRWSPCSCSIMADGNGCSKIPSVAKRDRGWWLINWSHSHEDVFDGTSWPSLFFPPSSKALAPQAADAFHVYVRGAPGGVEPTRWWNTAPVPGVRGPAGRRAGQGQGCLGGRDHTSLTAPCPREGRWGHCSGGDMCQESHQTGDGMFAALLVDCAEPLAGCCSACVGA